MIAKNTVEQQIGLKRTAFMSKKKTIITSSNLLLIEANKEHATFINQLVNCPTWIQHIGDRNVHSDKDAQVFIEDRLISSYVKFDFGLWVVIHRKKNEPIGLCGFVKRDYLEHPDIGFALLPKFAGKGFGKEAAIATLQYGIEQLKLTTILGITSPTNIISQRLLLSLGLHNMGIIVPPEANEELTLFGLDI